MEVKKIVEGMTAPQVAQVIDDNFKAQNAILEEDIAKQNNVIGVSEYKDFSEAEAVNVGDVRKYDGLLYECVEATTGAFDASKWKKSSFKAETEKKIAELGSYISNNEEYIRAYIDSEGKFLFGIRIDGTIEWAVGVPVPIKKALLNVESKVKQNTDEKITELESKVGLYGENPEFIKVITDAEGKILEAIKTDGTKYFGKGINIANQVEESAAENPEFIKVITDAEGKILGAIKKDGTHYFSKIKSPILDNIEDQLKKKTYTNPLSLQPMADPTIWNGEDGYWYALGTYNTGNRTFLRSANLVDWEDCKDYLITDEDFASLESEELWAPSMIKVGDKWNLYIGRERDRAMMCFQSSRPNGIFRLKTYLKRPTDNFDGEGSVSDFIDPYVFYDREGQLWMTYGGNTSYIARLNDDGLSFKEGEVAKHICGNSPKFGTQQSTEGVFIYNRNGYYYLFASVGNWGNGSYGLIVGRSKYVEGPYIDKEGRLLTDGYGTIILTSPSGILYGCGHNGEIFVDKNNKTYMFYHSWYVNDKTSRKFCLQELKWSKDDWPYFNHENKPSVENERPNV